MFYIDQEVINESALDTPELLLFYATSLNINFSQVLEQLIEKGLVHKTSPVVRYVLTDLGKEHLEYLSKEFFEHKESDDKLMELARELKNVFPQGKKEGLNYYWTESPVLIAKRLKVFFKKYGENYSYDDILNSAKRYVESFNGQYKLMQLLKYFIFKDKKGIDGNIENESQLLNFLENKDQEDLNDEWTSELK